MGDRTTALVFSASVPAAARPRVEKLFYFNPRQTVLMAQIRKTVEETGAPDIVTRDQRISLGVPDGSTQCLFVCAPADWPVGVAIYSRPTTQLIRILHLVVAKRAGVEGALVDRIRQIARSVRGVERIQLPYYPVKFVGVFS